MKLFSTISLAALCAKSTFGAPLDDLIDELPSYGRPPTPMFSGYLDASEGCDTAVNGPICKIHYWLAMADDSHYAENNPDYKPQSGPRPTVLWLNGGPGSSSLLGWLQEVGPLLLNATGGLMENPWAWTKANVNLMAIEAPMGVGFSYCSRELDHGKPCLNTDTNTAEASRAALVDFFKTKFPELYDGGFYIAGESYAGVYIPTLSRELLTNEDAQKHVPLKGILVGDPCTDNAAQKDSMDPIWYSQKYGLMDNVVFDILQSEECTEYMDKVHLRMMKQNSTSSDGSKATHSSKSHRSVGKQWSAQVIASELNEQLKGIQDLKERRLKAEELYQERVLGIVENEIEPESDDKSDMKTNLRMVLSAVPGMEATVEKNVKSEEQCQLAYRKFMMSSSHGLSQGWKDLYIDDYSLFAPITTKEDEQMAAYFNRDDVREALHVTDTSDTWPFGDAGFSYQSEFNACNWGPTIKFPNTTMVDIYQQIVPLLVRVWVYNGDTDPCVSYEGTREAVKQILKPELDGGSYRPWFYRQEAASLEVLAEKAILFGPDLVAQTLDQAQFAGEVTSYEDGLSFVTFHGSGHMVPQFRPQSSLHFLKRFLYASGEPGEELAPLLPKNSTLATISDDVFEAAMEDWTYLARLMADSN